MPPTRRGSTAAARPRTPRQTMRGTLTAAVAAALLLGVLAGLAAVFSLESFLDARKRRRRVPVAASGLPAEPSLLRR